MEISKKTCAMCLMEIPAKARKCHHCQHFQSKLWIAVFHPAFAAMGVAIPLIGALFFFLRMFDRGEDFGEFREQIEVASSEIAFGETKSGATVVVIGTVTNKSSVPWEEVTFHAEFFDAAGKRIDVRQDQQYSFVLPGKEMVSFKVSFRREFPEDKYVKHSVRVISAKDARTFP